MDATSGLERSVLIFQCILGLPEMSAGAEKAGHDARARSTAQSFHIGSLVACAIRFSATIHLVR